MSEATIKRTYERYAADIENACREGRHKELLHDYFRAVAADHALTVFELIGRTFEAKAAEFQGEEHALAWIEATLAKHGDSVLASVRVSMQAFNASAEDLAEAEEITAVAYQGRIEKLFEGAISPGGTA